MISDIPVKKLCVICKKEFFTSFPFREVCNICLLKALGQDKIIIDAANLKLWEVEK